MAATCDVLNNLFNQVIDQYQEPIYSKNFRENPYLTLIPRSEFTNIDGLQPKVVTGTFELPTSYPTALPNLALTDGTGDTCDIDSTTIYDGSITRDYQLEEEAFNTRTFCLTDLQFSWQASQMIGIMQKLMGQYSTVFLSDWYRVKNLCMINKKVGTLAAGATVAVETGDCDFVDLIAAGGTPTTALSWDHLNPLYDEQTLIGAGEFAVGQSEGQPLFALVTGPGVKRSLWQDDTQVRATVDWGDAFQNFTARGINTSINGFIPNVDLFIPRYDAGFARIYPTRNINVTKGRSWEPNPAYQTVAKGGSAVYEEFYILCREIWEAKFRPTGGTQFGMASFNPQNYVGDINFINNRTFCGTNDLGTKGFYRMSFSMAAKSIRPELGVAGLTLAL